MIADALSDPLSSPQVRDEAAAAAAAAAEDPFNTNPPNFQDTTAAAPVDTEQLDFQDMTIGHRTEQLPMRHSALSPAVLQGHRLAEEMSTGVWRQLLPPKHRRAVFNHLYNIAHQGRLATHRLISSRLSGPA